MCLAIMIKTIHQVTTMLATSKNVLFPSHNHLLTTGADDDLFYHLVIYLIISFWLLLWYLPEHQVVMTWK